MPTSSRTCARPITPAPMLRRAPGGLSAAPTSTRSPSPRGVCRARSCSPPCSVAVPIPRWPSAVMPSHDGEYGMTFDIGSASHVGKVRQRNEDSYVVRPDAGLWAVSDGMGGHDDGHVASQIVIEELRSVGIPCSATDLLEDCENHIATANRRLKEIGRARGVIVGATLALLLAFEDTTPASGRATAVSMSYATEKFS